MNIKEVDKINSSLNSYYNVLMEKMNPPPM